MAPHSSTLAWKIPWMEEPGRLRSMGRYELDTTDRLHFHFSLSCIGEGNSNPLQYSCLENPRDGEAWWVAIYGVAQSWTWLKRLSSSSSRGQEEKETTGDEMVRWHHWLNGHEFEQTLEDGEGQGSLVCCSPWGHKEADMRKGLNKTTTTITSGLRNLHCLLTIWISFLFYAYSKPSPLSRLFCSYSFAGIELEILNCNFAYESFPFAFCFLCLNPVSVRNILLGFFWCFYTISLGVKNCTMWGHCLFL